MKNYERYIFNLLKKVSKIYFFFQKLKFFL